ncbi:hypothetical protein DUNSADRAFT_3025 [Dunaliella salina]|uniref:Uncharacterized protein n=1 Tax=Dunaliella salina TaxID=3046 RepID=A0ABQ7FVQ3_DUNSA|nr:hypothetical protein DUNSADRAFT_3025 [Dunaliella salina]|eukprot:KAF5826465.1 hypothetical protein DUNSADRAFT_3025 [Dunaliella salina]
MEKFLSRCGLCHLLYPCSTCSMSPVSHFLSKPMPSPWSACIRVWDWKRWDSKCVATLQGHGAAVYSVAVSPDGKRLASGSFDKTIKLWRIAV